MSFSNEFICDNDKYEKSKIGKLRNERELIQAKTYKNWINSILIQARTGIEDIYTDLANGEKLILLLELITDEKIFQPNKGSMVLHKIENVSECLKFIRSKNVYLESIGPEDIVHGNRRLTLGLIWTIILRFQLSRHLDFPKYDLKNIKESLLLWCQSKTKDFKQAKVKNFAKSWQNGWAFVALIHSLRPDLVNEKDIKKLRQVELLQWAFDTANQHLYIPKILDAADVVKSPDENSILTYISYFYNLYTRTKNAETSAKRINYALNQLSEIESLKDSYNEMVHQLLDWIHKKTAHFEQVVDKRRAQEEMMQFNGYFFNERSVQLQVRNECQSRYFELVRLQKLVSGKTVPISNGLSLKDVERAWLHLERVETSYQACLKEMICQQERLSKLSEMFDIKSSKFETYVAHKLELLNAMFRLSKSRSMEELEVHLKQSELICFDILSNHVKFNSLISIADELIANQFNDVQFYKFFKTHLMTKLKSLNDFATYNQKTIDTTRRLLFQNKQLENLVEELLRCQSRVESISVNLTSPHKIIFALEKLKQLENDIKILEEIYDKIKLPEPLPESCFVFVEKSTIDQLESRVSSLLTQSKDLIAEKTKTLQTTLSIHEFMDELANIEAFLEEKQSISQTNPTKSYTQCNMLYLQRRNNFIKLEMKVREEELYATLAKGFQLMTTCEQSRKQIETCINRVKSKWKRTIQIINDRTFLLNDTSILFDLNQELTQLDLLMLDQESEPHIRVETLYAMSSKIEQNLVCFKRIIKKISRLSITVEKYSNINNQKLANDNIYLVYLKDSMVNSCQLVPSHNYLLIQLDNPHIKLISPQELHSNLLKLFVNHYSHIKSVISSTEFDLDAILLQRVLSNSDSDTTSHQVTHPFVTQPSEVEDISAIFDMLFARKASTEVGRLLQQRRSSFMADMESMSELSALIKQSLHLIRLLQTIVESETPHDSGHFSITPPQSVMHYPLNQTSELNFPDPLIVSHNEKQLIFIHKMKFNFETLLKISSSPTTNLEFKIRFMQELMEGQMKQISTYLQSNSSTADIDNIRSHLSRFIECNQSNMKIVQQMNWLQDQHQILLEHLNTARTLINQTDSIGDNDGQVYKTSLRRLKFTKSAIEQQHSELLGGKSIIESTNNVKLCQFYETLQQKFAKTERTIQICQARLVNKLTSVQLSKISYNLEDFPYYIETELSHSLKTKSTTIDSTHQIKTSENGNQWSLVEDLLKEMELVLFEAQHGYEHVEIKYFHVAQQASAFLNLQDEFVQKRFAELQKQIESELLRNKQRSEIERFEQVAKEFENECQQEINRIEVAMTNCDFTSQVTFRQTMARLELAYRFIRNDYNQSKSSEIRSKMACLQSLLHKFAFKVENFELFIQQYENINIIESKLRDVLSNSNFTQHDIDAIDEIKRSLEHVNEKLHPGFKSLVKKLNILRNRASCSLFTMKQKIIHAEIKIKLQHLKRVDSSERQSALMHSIETQLKALLANVPVSTTDYEKSDEVLLGWELISQKLNSILNCSVVDSRISENQVAELEWEAREQACNRNWTEKKTELVNSSEKLNLSDVPTLCLDGLTSDDQDEEKNAEKESSEKHELGNRDSALFTSSLDSSMFFDSLHSSNDRISHLASSQESVTNHLTSSSSSLYLSECDSGNCDINSDQFTPPSSFTPESKVPFLQMASVTNLSSQSVTTAPDNQITIASVSNSNPQDLEESFCLSELNSKNENYENSKYIFVHDKVNPDYDNQISSKSVLLSEENKLQVHSNRDQLKESHVLCYFENQVNIVNERVKRVCNQILELVTLESTPNVELVTMLESFQNKQKIYQDCVDCSMKNYTSIVPSVKQNQKFGLFIDDNNIQLVIPHADKLHILNAKISEIGLKLNNVEKIVVWSLEEKRDSETSSNLLDCICNKPFFDENSYESESIDQEAECTLNSLDSRSQGIQCKLSNVIHTLLERESEERNDASESFVYLPQTTLDNACNVSNEEIAKNFDFLPDNLNKLKTIIEDAANQPSPLIDPENGPCKDATELVKNDDFENKSIELSTISTNLTPAKYAYELTKISKQTFFDEISLNIDKNTENRSNQSVDVDLSVQSIDECQYHRLNISEFLEAKFDNNQNRNDLQQELVSKNASVCHHVYQPLQQSDEYNTTCNATKLSGTEKSNELMANHFVEIGPQVESTQTSVNEFDNRSSKYQYEPTDEMAERRLNLLGDRLHANQCQLDSLTQALLESMGEVSHHLDEPSFDTALQNVCVSPLGENAEVIDLLPNKLARLQKMLENATDQLLSYLHSCRDKTSSENVSQTFNSINTEKGLLSLRQNEFFEPSQSVTLDASVLSENVNHHCNIVDNSHAKFAEEKIFDLKQEVIEESQHDNKPEGTFYVCVQPDETMSGIESFDHQTKWESLTSLERSADDLNYSKTNEKLIASQIDTFLNENNSALIAPNDSQNVFPNEHISENEAEVDGEIIIDLLEDRVNNVQFQIEYLQQQIEALVQLESFKKSEWNFSKQLIELFPENNLHFIECDDSHQIMNYNEIKSQSDNINQHANSENLANVDIKQCDSVCELNQGSEDAIQGQLANNIKLSLLSTDSDKTNISRQTETTLEQFNASIQHETQTNDVFCAQTPNQLDLDFNLKTNCALFNQTLKQNIQEITNKMSESKLFNEIERETNKPINHEIFVKNSNQNDNLFMNLPETILNDHFLNTLSVPENSTYSESYENILVQNLSSDLKKEMNHSEMLPDIAVSNTKTATKDKLHVIIDKSFISNSLKENLKNEAFKLNSSLLKNSNNLIEESTTIVDSNCKSEVLKTNNSTSRYSETPHKTDEAEIFMIADIDETSYSEPIDNLDWLQNRVDVVQQQTETLLHQILTLLGFDQYLQNKSDLTLEEFHNCLEHIINKTDTFDFVKLKEHEKETTSFVDKSQTNEKALRKYSLMKLEDYSKFSIGSLKTNQNKVDTTDVVNNQNVKIISKEDFSNENVDAFQDLLKEQNAKGSCDYFTFGHHQQQQQQKQSIFEEPKSDSESTTGKVLELLMQNVNKNSEQLEIFTTNNNNANIDLNIKSESLHTSSDNSSDDELTTKPIQADISQLLQHDQFINFNNQTNVYESSNSQKIQIATNLSCLNETSIEPILQPESRQDKNLDIVDSVNSNFHQTGSKSNFKIETIEKERGKVESQKSIQFEEHCSEVFTVFKANVEMDSTLVSRTHDWFSNQASIVKGENVSESDDIACPQHFTDTAKRECILETTKVNTTRHFSFNEQSSGTDSLQRLSSAYTESSTDISEISGQVEHSNINTLAQFASEQSHNDVETDFNNPVQNELSRNNLSPKDFNVTISNKIKPSNAEIEEMSDQDNKQSDSSKNVPEESQTDCNMLKTLLFTTEVGFNQSESDSEDEQQNNAQHRSDGFFKTNDNNKMQVIDATVEVESKIEENIKDEFDKNIQSTGNNCQLLEASELFNQASTNKPTSLFSLTFLCQQAIAQNTVVSNQTNLSTLKSVGQNDITQSLPKKEFKTITHCESSTLLQDLPLIIDSDKENKVVENRKFLHESQESVYLPSVTVLEAVNDFECESTTQSNSLISRIKDLSSTNVQDELRKERQSESECEETDDLEKSRDYSNDKSSTEFNLIICESETLNLKNNKDFELPESCNDTRKELDLKNFENVFENVESIEGFESESNIKWNLLFHECKGQSVENSKDLHFSQFKNDPRKELELESKNILQTDKSANCPTSELSTKFNLILESEDMINVNDNEELKLQKVCNDTKQEFNLKASSSLLEDNKSAENSTSESSSQSNLIVYEDKEELNLDICEGFGNHLKDKTITQKNSMLIESDKEEINLEIIENLQSTELREDLSTQENYGWTSEINVSDSPSSSGYSNRKELNLVSLNTSLFDETTSMLFKRNIESSSIMQHNEQFQEHDVLVERNNFELTLNIDRNILESLEIETTSNNSESFASIKNNDLFKTTKSENDDHNLKYQVDSKHFSLLSDEEGGRFTNHSMHIESLENGAKFCNTNHQATTNLVLSNVNDCQSSKVQDELKNIKDFNISYNPNSNPLSTKHELNILTENEKHKKCQPNNNQSKTINQDDMEIQVETSKPTILTSKFIENFEPIELVATLENSGFCLLPNSVNAVFPDSSINADLSQIKKHDFNDVVDSSGVSLKPDFCDKDKNKSELLGYNLTSQPKSCEMSNASEDFVPIISAHSTLSEYQNLLSRENSSVVHEKNEDQLPSGVVQTSESLQMFSTDMRMSTQNSSCQTSDIEPSLSVMSQRVNHSPVESNSRNPRDQSSTINSESNWLSRVRRIVRYSLPFHLLALCLLLLLLLCPHEEYEFNCLLRNDYASSNIMKVYPNGPPPL